MVVVVVVVAVVVVVVGVVLDTIRSVCVITPPNACTELPAYKKRANMETWACTRSQGITPPQS